MSFYSCDKGNDPANGVKVTLDVTGFPEDSVAFTTGEYAITVTLSDQDADWRVKSSDLSIATCDPQRGTGDGAFTVKVTANPDEKVRTATVTIYLTDDETISKDFTINQKPRTDDFDFEDSGLFSDKAVSVRYFWSAWNAPYADGTPALCYHFTLAKAGTLTIELDPTYLHIFLHNEKPATAPILSWIDKTIPKMEEIGEYDDGVADAFNEAVYAPNGDKDYVKSGGGDIEKQDRHDKGNAGSWSWDLPAGEYWTTHTLEEFTVPGGEVVPKPNEIQYTYKATFRAK
ncbi:MAG: BACON domain-containing protein [Dysgonamonadaceae bacterium]|nr:BACON domain-containing protein [Dysgonamonadaceae bacterium]